jgi:phage gpG-like protein
MSDGIYIDTSGLKEIERFIREIERNGGNVKAPLGKWGAYQLQETGRTFDRGGRGPVKWPPLSEMTLALRKHRGRGKNPKRMLQVSGHLKRSVQTATILHKSTQAQALFSRVPYAADHQHGTTKTIAEQVIVPKKAKALAFFVKGSGRSGAYELVFAKKVVQPAREVKIPQRQFLFILPRDIQKAVTLFKEHAAAVAKKATRRK